jgi:hypothetical protein
MSDYEAFAHALSRSGAASRPSRRDVNKILAAAGISQIAMPLERSRATVITTPRSPGMRYGFQSLKHARNTALNAKMKLLPPRLPTTSQASVKGTGGGAVRPVQAR